MSYKIDDETVHRIAQELLFLLHRESAKGSPDFTTVSGLVTSLRLLPIHITELIKYY